MALAIYNLPLVSYGIFLVSGLLLLKQIPLDLKQSKYYDYVDCKFNLVLQAS